MSESPAAPPPPSEPPSPPAPAPPPPNDPPATTALSTGQRARAAILRVLIAIFGRPNWEAPAWGRFVGGKVAAAGRWGWARKATSAAILVALAGVGYGGFRANAWWKARPKPALTTWRIDAPTGLPQFLPNGQLGMEEMAISFSRSAAPLPNVNKPITKGIEITPPIAGEWRWSGDRDVRFLPKADWAIGTKYTVRINPKELIAAHLLVEETKHEFETQPFDVKLTDHKYYQDPTDETLKRVLVTFHFSHPVDAASFEKGLKLIFKPSTADEKEREYAFEVGYEKQQTIAYVKSKTVTLPQKNALMITTLQPGTKAKRGSAEYKNKLESKSRVPGLYNFISIDSVETAVVDNEKLEADVVLLVSSNTRISAAEMKKNFKAWVLPIYADDDEKQKKRAHEWSAEEVDVSTLKKQDLVTLTQLPERDDPSETHSFRYRADAGRYLYLELEKGTQAFGGYVLGETYNHVVRVPKAPPRVKLLHKGSLISLTGDHKIATAVRDAAAVRYSIGRVLPDQAHHIFSATNGSFQDPSFRYPFTEANFTERFVDVHPTTGPLGKNVFDTLDLSKYLGDGKRGMFVIKAESWDPERSIATGQSDSRMLLVSDLGLVVKDTAEGTHQVFVQSIHTGEPVAGARVSVLGKNGVAIETETTGSTGLATLPSFADKRDEQQPVVYVAQRGRDATYLPIGRSERYLNVSRFDAGGVHADASKRGISAFVFSDRGIYRPGDEMRFGAILRNDDWSKSLAGLPLLFVLTDARGKTLAKQQINASPAAFEEFLHKTDETSPTGSYKLELFLADGKGHTSIGSAHVVVREFQPDRMKIHVALSNQSPDGWIKPAELSAKIHLTNLFGTPATERKVKGQLSVQNGMPRFAGFRDYTFFDPLKWKHISTERMEEQTDDEGNAEFSLDTSAFADATYRLSFAAEGFEREGGRSVTGEVGAWVSPLDFFVGYRSSGAELSYLPKGSEAEIELVAIGPAGKRIAVKDLELKLSETRYLSVLAKEPDGTYRYESIERQVELSKRPQAIADSGTKLKIPTATPGTFVYKLFDKSGREVNHIEFTVAGAAVAARSLDRNAELQLALRSKDVEAGQSLSVQIKAPYTGAGLLTIEREKVFTHRWFKTTATTSVQSIPVPANLEGDAYVSVVFLRDASSPEVFLSPVSYGVVPFSISRQKRTAKITLAAPDKVKPGETVTIKVSADRPARAVVFAIDEGILRVARYQSPDPLKFFFQKRALGVQTAQILDLVLPELGRLLKAYAPGGGDDEDGEGGSGKKALSANLNPFARKTAKPVAYWSGIIDIGPEVKELAYPVPDSFNGTLRIMAVAAAPDAIGAAERETISRGDFVLSPNTPLVVAPGDEFEVPLAVSNNVIGSGAGKKAPEVEVALAVSKQFELVGQPKVKVAIAELREGTARFKLKATKALGSGTLTFSAKLGDKGGKATVDISVRPASPYLVTVKGGRLPSGEQKVAVDRKLYPEFRELAAGVTYLPVGLSHGLVKYLDKFPHACTEQLASQALPSIVLGESPEFGYKAAKVAENWQTFSSLLRARQNPDGGFGRWARNPRVDPWASIYATHVLLEAKDRGKAVPDDLLKAALGFAKVRASDTIESMADARERAYAIYVLTRSGQQTAPLVAKLQKQLEAKYAKIWKSDLTAAYLGAVLRLLKQDKAGEALFDKLKLGDKIEADYARYYDPLARDAQILYLLARHFPDKLASLEPAQVEHALKPIYDGGFNTFSAAYAVMALEQYGRSAQQKAPDALGIAQRTGDAANPLALPRGLMPFAPFADSSTALVFSNKGEVGAYWLMSQQGFDLPATEKPITQKLEITRRILGEDGKPIAEVGLGDEVTVELVIRSLRGNVPSLAIVDLLPGGFEVVLNDAPAADESDHEEAGDPPPRDRDEGDGEGGGEGEGGEGGGEGGGDPGDINSGGGSYALPFAQAGSSFSPEYGDLREDRVVLYGTATDGAETFLYKAKATTVGTFVVPPAQASSMYDRGAMARSAAASIKVVPKVEPKVDDKAAAAKQTKK